MTTDEDDAESARGLWTRSEHTRKLRKELEKKIDSCGEKLFSVAGKSSDPEVIRAHAKLAEMGFRLKMLEDGRVKPDHKPRSKT